ncbi:MULTISPECIES: bifunctional UDP-N-acetylglucosamine diphosphorylase/glucosamine-1-phosphate N-acetyltransferase GlmU [Nocardiopsis]|uniref:Bifunctional protein GlmU n=1 Tax=Nocardiopsis dassonvillei (strain ATCC 23218 / DSM 43111 / CIP 107115 / JCM 7437 / KCTC 9190 / NBRC 14626 / NCTC 10488 / NRRL B-5397 / IMRU 509) TaxID=446468 RepID=D7B7J2_NOCDD|nr:MULTISPECIES: bifunctional UDP-N-acetylglucosamine diphosphorylase/glucosamine-1-phosphate N-acetyltransferase GlmU [Nocardiopsis]ADH69387.1 UDP-N-acetylglucosamine pyrophosphorylase [Nocardiopsis dassonvillei subsp. dassonvillei DSM 43111]NKY81657.1 bifunctional UDP-N-acetylglucosamine diphosphorylase/glucosamine-1-phosphate N-acetyltransferase GlmU [Nocardiopsis dassonvillei]VEI89897.1 Bifunctional protein GlmU [Nocardiopsis dassonvillei]
MSVNRPAAVIVLAAGEGTRMKSKLPKVLHELNGRSMLGHVLAAARELDPQHAVVVVGHAREQVRSHLEEIAPQAATAVQEEQNGTGHAVRMAIEDLAAKGVKLSGTVVLTCGDTPLLRGSTLAELVAAHDEEGNAVTVLSARVPDPHGYGRIVRDADGDFTGIVEHADATPEQHAIDEINSGMYAFDGALLSEVVQRLSTDNAKGEEYVTDAVSLLRGDGHRVGAWAADDWHEVQGVNNRVQLSEARRVLNDRLVNEHMLAGVTVVDPATTWIDAQVTIGRDTVIEPGTRLLGATSVGEDAVVGPRADLRDTVVGAGATVRETTADRAEIGPGASVGPYTYLRPGTRLAERSKAGAFVEVKNSNVGAESKIPHLTYVGDADIGVGSNIGCSSVFVNYDGVNKSRSVIGDHVRIGSDNTIVAPVRVGDGAYSGAGTVVRDDVPPGALAVSEGHRQRNVEGWTRRKRPGTPSAEAAEQADRHRADDKQ